MVNDLDINKENKTSEVVFKFFVILKSKSKEHLINNGFSRNLTWNSPEPATLKILYILWKEAGILWGLDV